MSEVTVTGLHNAARIIATARDIDGKNSPELEVEADRLEAAMAETRAANGWELSVRLGLLADVLDGAGEAWCAALARSCAEDAARLAA